MTWYSAVAPVSVNAASGDLTFAQSMAVQNGSPYTMRVCRIDYEYVVTNSSMVYLRVHRYENSTISGGVSVTPFPLRQGSTPTGVTSRCRTYSQVASSGAITQSAPVVVTGTPILITSIIGVSGQSATWEPPSDLSVAPGSSLYFTTAYANVNGTAQVYCRNIVIYFEEIQENWTDG